MGRIRAFFAISLVSLALLASASADAARTTRASADTHCPPLPPPSGTIVRVDSVQALQQAVRDPSPNTTILIAPGEYRLTNTLHLYGGIQGLTIRGETGDPRDVQLIGRGMANRDFGNVPHGVLIWDADDVLLADLTIREVYYHAVQVAGEHGPERTRLYNLRLVDAGEQIVKGSSGSNTGPYADEGEVACSWIGYSDRARSDYTNGVDVLAGKDWVVRDNDFVRIRAPRGQLAGPAILFWRNSIGTVVERNRFFDCDRGIALGLSSPDLGRARDGETVYDHQDGVIRNNFVFRHAGEPGDIGITVNHHRNFKILHNTVVQHGTFGPGTIEYRFATSSGQIFGNLGDGPIWRRDGASAVLDDNVTDAQVEWFVDASEGNLHLKDSAIAAIDRIAPGDAHPEVLDDIDGERRPAGAGLDVGADELGGTRPEPSATPGTRPSSTPPGTGTGTATARATQTPSPTAAGPTEEATPTAEPGAGRIWMPAVYRDR